MDLLVVFFGKHNVKVSVVPRTAGPSMAILSPLVFLRPLKALTKNKFEKKTRKMSSGPGRAGDVGMTLG